MEFLRQAPSFIFTKECINEYFFKYNFLHGECFKASLSKTLGLGIIAGSLMVKVPQILKIFQGKSAKGINVLSVFLELFGMTATASYSYAKQFPFSAWGDSLFVGLQTVIIAFLVLYYNSGFSKASTFLATYIAIITPIVLKLTPIHVLWAGQSLVIPIALSAKVVQANTNYGNGSTGQLSAVTAFLVFFGAFARIFTSIQETGDPMMVITYIVATIANGIIVFQVLYYWNSEEMKSQKKKQ